MSAQGQYRGAQIVRLKDGRVLSDRGYDPELTLSMPILGNCEPHGLAMLLDKIQAAALLSGCADPSCKDAFLRARDQQSKLGVMFAKLWSDAKELLHEEAKAKRRAKKRRR